MTLNDIDVKRREIYHEYARILDGFYNTCMKTRSLNRSLSAYRNYETFAEVTGMKRRFEYAAIYKLRIIEMICNIEELAQKE